jgi:hypothetical protein
VTNEHRPGGSSLSQTEGKAASEGTPGKMTLTQQLSSEPGLARIEGGTLLSGPDPTISNEGPALATPEKTDAEYEKSMGKGVASFYPAKPTATTGAVQELLDAATRWDGIAGNTKANL